MSKILRRGDEITNNEESDAEQAPKVETPTPQIMNTKQSKTKPPGKIPKVHVCGDCGEQFARNTCLTKHIKELRCPVIRRRTLDKELELAEKEKKLRDLESEISNKILKAQEKVKKTRKPRVAKPKALPNSPAQQPVKQPTKEVVQQQPKRQGTIINF